MAFGPLLHKQNALVPYWAWALRRSRVPFSSISICWIFRLFRILMATLCPVRVCSATLTCKAQRCIAEIFALHRRAL